jgi:hypothetical protein
MFDFSKSVYCLFDRFSNLVARMMIPRNKFNSYFLSFMHGMVCVGGVPFGCRTILHCATPSSVNVCDWSLCEVCCCYVTRFVVFQFFNLANSKLTDDFETILIGNITSSFDSD